MLIYGSKTPTLVNKIPQPFGGQVKISINKINIENGINIRFRSSTCHLTRATSSSRSRSILLATAGLLAAAAVIASASAAAMESPENSETLSNIPQTLSGECVLPTDCKKARIQRPKSRKAESCTIKCVTTCIRGGDGSPGEGPFNVRRPLVVFKQGFRSRQYWILEDRARRTAIKPYFGENGSAQCRCPPDIAKDECTGSYRAHLFWWSALIFAVWCRWALIELPLRDLLNKLI